MTSRWTVAFLGGLLASCSDDAEPSAATSSASASSDSDSASSTSSSGNGALCPSNPAGRRVIDIQMLNHAGLALLSDGTLWCWGDGLSLVCPVVGSPRQLTRYPCLDSMEANGLNLVGLTREGDVWATTEATRGAPRKVNDGPAAWVAQGGHLLAWGGGGAAWWWGEPPWLEQPPVEPTAFPWGPIDGITLGTSHACFWRDGAVKCFGTNEEGQIGDGGTSADPVTEPTVVELPVPIQFAVAGDQRTYAVDLDQVVWVWGTDYAGIVPSTPTPAQWTEVGRTSGLTSGGYADCLWRSNGDVLCWGGNPGGVLVSDGSAPLPNPIPPTRRSDLEPAKLIDSYSDSPLCALKLDGTVWCRGDYASFGQTSPDDDFANLVPFEDP